MNKTIYIVLEKIDDEVTVVGASLDEDTAEALRAKVIRDYATEAIECGTAPEGLSVDEHPDDLEDALHIDVSVQGSSLS